MSDTKQTCADLVALKMQSRAEDFEILYDILDDSDSTEEDIERATEDIYSTALEITSYKVYKILMSTGGPADWIEVKVDENNFIMGMEYHYADWFDHAQISIPNNSYLWEYAEQTIALEK